MIIKNLSEIDQYNPCQEAKIWLSTQTDPQSAWNNCKRGDWLWWIVRKICPPTKEQSILFANNCSNRAKGYTAAAYAADYATYAAAYAAANAANAAYDAANAAYAAAYAAYYAAYYAAANAAANAAATYAAADKENSLQADFIRSIINPFNQ